MRFDGTVATALSASLARRRRQGRGEARRRRDRRVLPPLLPQPASTRSRPRQGARQAPPGRLRDAVVGRAAADQGVRARLDHGRQRLRGAGAVDLSVAPEREAEGRGVRRRRDDHAVARRRGADRRVEPRRRRRRAVGPRRRRGRRHVRGPPPRRAQLDHVRHGRHQHRHRALAERRGPAHRREAGRASRRSRCPRSTSTRWAPAAARSRASPGKILHVGPGERRRRSRARPATAGAAPRRPSRTPTSCSASSIRGTSSAGASRSTRARRRRRSTAIARQLGTSAIAAAEGISKVVNTNMAEGIRIVSVRRGRRSAAVHARRLRRRRRAARHGGRAPARDQARRRAQRRGRAVGVGHAGHRSALRDGAVARERGLAHDPGRPAPRSSCAWRRRGATRLGGFAGEIAVRRSLDMRYGEQIFEISVPIDGVDLAAPDVIDAGGRALPPAPRGAVRLQRAGTGGRHRQRAGGRDRQAARAARRAAAGGRRAARSRPRAGACTSATGWRCPCTSWTACPRGSSEGPGHLRVAHHDRADPRRTSTRR